MPLKFLGNSSKNKVGRSNKTESRPNVIHLDGDPHYQGRERDKDQQRHSNLEDLKLRQSQCGMSNPISWNMDGVLEEGNAPADQSRDIPGLVIKCL